MKKKYEMIHELEVLGYNDVMNMEWKDLRPFYYEKMKEIRETEQVKTKKKVDMVNELEELGYMDAKDMKWKDLQPFYYEKMKTKDKVIVSKPDQDEIEVKTKKMGLEGERELLMPKIQNLMDRLKGKMSASHGEVAEMFQLYNAYYKRSDSSSCSSCVARVYDAFLRITKK